MISRGMKWDGRKAKGAARAGANRGLLKWAEHVLEQANRIVPIEKGANGGLLSTGVTSQDESKLTVAVSYDKPYAVRQHEELEYKHDAGRRAKYLEEPLNASKSLGGGMVASEIKREL